MKRLLKNRKGFTLIELLAVIVILAILVMVAIPAVTKYLNAARQGTFADNAQAAISAVRNDVIMNGFQPDTTGGNVQTYSKDKIDALLEKKLEASPFGGQYEAATIQVVQNPGSNNSATYIYKMCLYDKGKRGFPYTEEKNISDKVVQLGSVNSCTPSS